jgi:transposase-like protein
LPRSALHPPQRLPQAAAHHPGGGPDPGHPKAEAGQLLPQLAGAPPPGRQGPLRRGDGGLHRRHLHPPTWPQASRPLDHAHFPYVYLDATYLHGRLGRNLQVVSRAVVVAIGINALGFREVLGIAVGDSEAEAFWCQFLGSLKERGLTGTRLVISDAHLGLTAAIKRMFQGCSWQRCRVHFLRNLLSHVPKAGQGMVAAAMKAVFVIQKPEQVRAHWQQVTEMLHKQFPGAVPVMETARDDVLAFLHFPQEHGRKIWSTNSLERLNVAPRGALSGAAHQTPHQRGRHFPQ